MKVKHSIIAVSFFPLLFIMGCTTLGVDTWGIIPGVSPLIDQPFRSVHYYESTYHVDLFKNEHQMSDELNSEREATAFCNKLYSRINIMGTSPKCQPHEDLYIKSKKNSNNNYTISCSTVPTPEIQKGDGYCWAACAQFLMAACYGKHIDQEAFIEKIKGKNATTLKDQAGSILDTMRALGFGGLNVYYDASYALLESLAINRPVIIGLSSTKQEIGHAVVVVAARYSFTSATLPPWPVAGKYAFAELLIYDPTTGTFIKKPATEIEQEISFVIVVKDTFRLHSLRK